MYIPWSFDATTYRLPRLLYWWAAHHWYWIGTLDHRLDYSSCGYEWQMLPVMILTRTDRLIFLLSWIPFLLMPGLVFFAFRAFGVSGRSARRWMWLLPSGFCYALQSGGLQNDGYTVGYTLAVITFAALVLRTRRGSFLWLSLLAAALLMGAKLSNLPMLLPLGLIVLPSLRVANWFNWRNAVVIFIAIVCSFIPLSFLCWKHTGDWTGDPTDQSLMQNRNPMAALVDNTIAMVRDSVQPPVFPLASRINAQLAPLNQSAFMRWLHQQVPESGVLFHFGNMAYEGQCGLGSGVGLYLLFLLAGSWFVKPSDRKSIGASDCPWEWRLAPWTMWLSLGVLLAKVASNHTIRYAAPYYPLLLISILRLPRIAVLERCKIAAVISVFSILTVVPAILLTPARPVIPVDLIARAVRGPAFETILAKYKLWDGFRDDLAPLRNALPPGTTKLGYAGAYRDTSYGLWKPFGSRVVTELGLPLGRNTRPPADLDYAVITERGLRERYGLDMDVWCNSAGANVVFEMKRNAELEGETAKYDSWYLVKFRRD
jgi:hypothetical protein